MTARIIDGKNVAAEVEKEIAADLAALASRGIRPGLVAVRVGDDPASEIYVRNKAKKAEELGLRGTQKHLSASITQAELERELDALNADDEVDGILLQLPLPAPLKAAPLLARIDPAKDVDGFHPINVGNLHLGKKALVPCTPAGVMRLLDSTGVSAEGKEVVVVGRSDIVGKPVAALLLQRNATVTIAHSRTRDLGDVVYRAEIVIAAVGKPYLIRGHMIRDGAVVIDVGMNRLPAGSPEESLLDQEKMATMKKNGSVLVGDVEFPTAKERASFITPVPGGVGPMTIAMLMRNTVQAAMDRRK